MNPREAIEAAELAEHEIAYRNQLARQMYEAGHGDGYEAGRRDAEADMARFWAEAARSVTRGVSHAELEQRRCSSSEWLTPCVTGRTASAQRRAMSASASQRPAS